MPNYRGKSYGYDKAGMKDYKKAVLKNKKKKKIKKA
jgi:hypothetical protein